MFTLQKNKDLTPYTTFATQAKAKFFVIIQDKQEVLELLASDERKNNAHYILGKGANTLFTQDVDGLVVKIELMGKELVRQDETHVRVYAGAGEDRNDLVQWTVDQGRGGAENMIAIPSTVGAAIVGNIGAYGTEIQNIVAEVSTIDLETKQEKIYTTTECNFAYRTSYFKHHPEILITGAIFCLTKITPAYICNTGYKDIQDAIVQTHSMRLLPIELAQIITQIRANKLPDYKTLGTAGSFFKNPIISTQQYEILKEKYPNMISYPVDQNPKLTKLSAGQLIDLAGFKGYREGNVGIYPKHALIIVNYGGATGQEIVALAHLIQAKITQQFGVSLESEVMWY